MIFFASVVLPNDVHQSQRARPQESYLVATVKPARVKRSNAIVVDPERGGNQGFSI
ncbi:MAG: hypothetical protein ABGY96_13525 [bacterium]